MTGWNFPEGDEIAPGLRAVRLLGGGKRYEAYLAWADHLRALVVVKVLRPSHVGDARGALRARRRCCARSRTRCSCARTARELAGERPHLVLEHIEGPRLSTLMRRYGMNLEQLLPLALNLCAVLHYLAHERVVHLDVKPQQHHHGRRAAPDRPQHRAPARRAATSCAAPVGTDLWMAPEQRDVDRFGEIGPASDVWGLGATLRAAMPDRVPAPVGDAVAACLAPRPADRPTADELARVLEPLVDALPAPRLGRFRPSPRRRTHHQEVHR